MVALGGQQAFPAVPVWIVQLVGHVQAQTNDPDALTETDLINPELQTHD